MCYFRTQQDLRNVARFGRPGRSSICGIRENISPTIAALATILIVFSTCLLLTFEWLRGRAAAKAIA